MSKSFIKLALYKLKRDYGLPLVLYHIVSEQFDPDTGIKKPIIETKEIKRAIVLPRLHQRKFEYDLGYLAANSNFVYGALYDPTITTIIIDSKDLSDFTINLDDYLICNDERYNIKDKENYDLGWIIQAKKIEGAPSGRVIECSFITEMSIDSDFISEIV